MENVILPDLEKADITDGFQKEADTNTALVAKELGVGGENVEGGLSFLSGQKGHTRVGMALGLFATVFCGGPVAISSGAVVGTMIFGDQDKTFIQNANRVYDGIESLVYQIQPPEPTEVLVPTVIPELTPSIIYVTPEIIDFQSLPEQEKNTRIKIKAIRDKLKEDVDVDIADQITFQYKLDFIDGGNPCLLFTQESALNFESNSHFSSTRVLKQVELIDKKLREYGGPFIKKIGLKKICFVYDGQADEEGEIFTPGVVGNTNGIFINLLVSESENSEHENTLAHEVGHGGTMNDTEFIKIFDQINKEIGVEYVGDKWIKDGIGVNIEEVSGVFDPYALHSNFENIAVTWAAIMGSEENLWGVIARSTFDEAYRQKSQATFYQIYDKTDGKIGAQYFAQESGISEETLSYLLDLDGPSRHLPNKSAWLQEAAVTGESIEKGKFFNALFKENPELKQKFMRALAQNTWAIVGRDEALKQMLYEISFSREDEESQKTDQFFVHASDRRNASDILSKVLADKNGLTEILNVSEEYSDNLLVLQLVMQKLYLLTEGEMDSEFWQSQTGLDALDLETFFQFDQAQSRFSDTTRFSQSLNPDNIAHLRKIAQEILEKNTIKNTIKNTKDDLSNFSENGSKLSSLFTQTEIQDILNKSLEKHKRGLVLNLSDLANISAIIEASSSVPNSQILILGEGSKVAYESNNSDSLAAYVQSHFPPNTNIIVIIAKNELGNSLVRMEDDLSKNFMEKYRTDISIYTVNLGENKNPDGTDIPLLDLISSKSE